MYIVGGVSWKEREERGRVCVALLHQTSLHSEKLLQHFFIKSMLQISTSFMFRATVCSSHLILT